MGLEELEEEARELGRAIDRRLPAETGFALLIFDFGEGGDMTYLSNARREDMIQAFKELLEELEREPRRGGLN